MILTQAVFATQRFAPEMAKRGFGRFLFISSILAKYPGLMAPHYFLSCLARSALFALAKLIQAQYAGNGVAAFTLALGYVDTPLLRNMALGEPLDADAPPFAPGNAQPWRPKYDEWSASIPAGRIASAEELAEVVAFLVSPAADYLNGTVFSFAGGLDTSII